MTFFKLATAMPSSCTEMSFSSLNVAPIPGTSWLKGLENEGLQPGGSCESASGSIWGKQFFNGLFEGGEEWD